jgi:hypothetical protein
VLSAAADSLDIPGRERAFDGVFWGRLAMGCDRLCRSLNGAAASPQGHGN